MAEPHESWHVDIFEFLKHAVDQGLIEIPFSALHVLEGAHLKDHAKPMALKRATVMKRLAGNKCFTWWGWLMNHEALLLAANEGISSQTHATRDDGRWFPEFDIIAKQVGLDLETSIKSCLSELPLPRNRRRHLKQQLIKDGRLTKTGVALVEQNRAEATRKVRQEFPLPQRVFDEDIIFRVVTGKLPKKAFVEAIEEALGDLPTFLGWVLDRYDSGRILTGWLRTNTLVDVIGDERTKLDAIVDSFSKIAFDPNEVNKIFSEKAAIKLAETRARCLWKIFDDVKHRGISRDAWNERVIRAPFGKIPSLDAMLDIAFEYGLKNLSFGPHRRKLRVSDYGDILHMIYLPHVDLFRCDGYMAQLAKGPAKKNGVIVVNKLRELPTAIDKFSHSIQAQ